MKPPESDQETARETPIQILRIPLALLLATREMTPDSRVLHSIFSVLRGLKDQRVRERLTIQEIDEEVLETFVKQLESMVDDPSFHFLVSLFSKESQIQ